jgi:ubiquinone/menaquinone biosynthesis C-methylase UbiE
VSGAGRYVPALGLPSLTRFYDPVVALTTRERTFKARLLDQLDPQPGQRILDLACGTGTFARATAEREPKATVMGVDGDAEMLARARAKAPQIAFDKALAQDLPYDDDSFDAVATSLFLHHLTRDMKLAALREVARVLKPGGTLHVADWGPPGDPLMAAAFMGIRLLDGMEPTRDNASGGLPRLYEAAGFDGIEERGSLRTAFGRLVFHSARRAAHRHCRPPYADG